MKLNLDYNMLIFAGIALANIIWANPVLVFLLYGITFSELVVFTVMPIALGGIKFLQMHEPLKNPKELFRALDGWLSSKTVYRMVFVTTLISSAWYHLGHVNYAVLYAVLQAALGHITYELVISIDRSEVAPTVEGTDDNADH